MRELKFRAWDKQTLQMSPEFVLFGEFTLLGAVHAWQHYCGNQSNTSLEALDDLEVMQFTGLKDKNGVDIFEGDIVMFLDRDWMDFEKDTKRLPVVYLMDAFVLQDLTPNKYGEFCEYRLFKDYGRDRFEVIGNIYQHKHLLK